MKRPPRGRPVAFSSQHTEADVRQLRAVFDATSAPSRGTPSGATAFEDYLAHIEAYLGPRV